MQQQLLLSITKANATKYKVLSDFMYIRSVPKGAWAACGTTDEESVHIISSRHLHRLSLEQTGDCWQLNTSISHAREQSAKRFWSRGFAVPFCASGYATHACAPTRGYRDEGLGIEMESERPLAFIDHKSLRSLRIHVMI